MLNSDTLAQFDVDGIIGRRLVSVSPAVSEAKNRDEAAKEVPKNMLCDSGAMMAPVFIFLA